MKRVYIFDICGTLYNSNTTFDFLEYFLSHANTFYRKYSTLRKTFIWRLVNKFFIKFFHKDLTRIIALHFLEGRSCDELKNAAESFYNDFLFTRQNIEIIEDLKTLSKNPQNKVIILSATLDFIANTIARHLGCQYCYSSQLVYDKNICQGKLYVDLLGKKLEIIFKNFKGTFAAVYTDDFSDLPLLSLAKVKNVIVYPKTQKRWKKILKKKGWNATIIQY